MKIEPVAVATALIRAGAFLTGYELVKTAIVDEVKGFFLVGFDERGMTYSETYERDVLSLDRNRFRASAAWLVSMEALTLAQLAELDAIYAHRNEVAHELATFLVDPDAEISVQYLQALRGIMRSLDRFWGGINADTNPQFDDDEVDYDNIQSGAGLLLDYLLQLSGIGEGDQD